MQLGLLSGGCGVSRPQQQPRQHRQHHQHPPRHVVCKLAHHRHHDPLPDHRFPLSEGLPLSMYHPYKKLPPEGTTLPLEEEVCDPEERACRTPLHVYEARCGVCSGTGWARAPSNGRRGHLGTCMVCHGLGFVRRTTSRFCPDDPDRHLTLARPLTWNGKFAARPRPDGGMAAPGSSSSSSSSSNGGSSSSSSSNGGSPGPDGAGSSNGSNGSSSAQASPGRGPAGGGS